MQIQIQSEIVKISPFLETEYGTGNPAGHWKSRGLLGFAKFCRHRRPIQASAPVGYR